VSKFLKWTNMWLWGGFLYYVCELLYRQHSHPLMFAVGGLCFVTLGCINRVLPWEMSFAVQCAVGGFAITAIEFISGLIFNVWLGLDIWDYSHLPLNVMGQVCVYFLFVWFVMAGVGIWLDDNLRWQLYGETKPHYYFIGTEG